MAVADVRAIVSGSRVTVRGAVVVVAAACAVVAAETVDLRAEPERRCFVSAPDSGTSSARVEALQLGTTRCSGRRLRLYRLVQADGGARPVVAGMSGSPVTGPDGTVVGFAAAQLWSGDSPYLGVLPSADLNRSWRRARRAFPSSEGAASASDDAPRPGSSIVVLDVWGDWVHGWQGTLSARDGAEVAAMAHSVERVGPCVRALAAAPVSGIDSNPMRSAYRWETGDVVGSVYFDGAAGVFGRLGEPPPSSRFSIVVRHPAGETVLEEVHVAQDPQRGALSLEAVVAHALQGATTRGERLLTIDAVLDGSRASYRVRTEMANWRTAARAVLESMDGGIVRDGALLVDVASLEIEVSDADDGGTPR